MALQGILRFPGIFSVRDWSFTLSHGISPSVAVLEIIPQEDFPADPGVMTIEFGDVLIEFPGCVIDQATVKRDRGGMVTSVSIKDRRWMWKFGTPLSGRFNLRNQDGSIWQPSLMSTQDLALECLDAMGEEGADVSGLPMGSYPEVNWNHANGAQELDRLVSGLGCRIVYDLDDIVSIQVAGQGDDLPTVGARTLSFGVDPPDKPDSLLLVGGATRYETAFVLEPVGEEVDGSIVTIANLTYAPTNGWGSEAVVNGQFGNVTCPNQWLARFNNSQTNGDDYVRSLARKCVYKWFRIKSTTGQTENNFQIQGCSLLVNTLYQLLPIEDNRVTIYTDTDNIQRPLPSLVFGQWWDASQDASTPTNNRAWLDGHSLDRDKGIVKLNKPAVRITPGTSPPFSDPTLYLLVAHSVKDPQTLVEDRYTFELDLPGESFGAGQQAVHRPDVVRQVIGQYDSTGNPTGFTENSQLLQVEAQYYLSAALARFDVVVTTNVELRGIVPISPDGAIQQVTWKGGFGGATTTASRNNEWSTEVMPFEERRRIAQQLWSQQHLNHAARIPAPPVKGPLQ